MPKVKIETLTPVHIGSGNDLSEDTEFLFFDKKNEDSENEKIIAVIDEDKVLKIIKEENIGVWVNIIQRQSGLKDYLKQRNKGKLSATEIKKRIIGVYGEKTKTLKEQLHDGRQKPYIPGSSIKGAIRTAILAQKALSNKELAKKIDNKFTAEKVEHEFFGNDANKNIFRFLLTGDAYFDYETIAINANTLNLQGNGWKFKKGHSQLVECITNGAETSFNLKINSELIKKNKEKKTIYTDTDFLSLNKLFPIINKHTLSLLKKELDFWNGENIEKNIFDYYKEILEELIDISEKCNENEAVLRIGYGSGWNFITGSWAKDKDIMSDSEYENLIESVRKKKYNEDVPFPKTRKVDEFGDMFGFVKLTF